MKRATKDILYFETGPDNPPTLRVAPGEEFEVQTQLNRGPWLDTHPEGERLRGLLRGGNPSSGCVWVEGAEPAQVLTVHIGEIRLDPLGFTRFVGANGAMPGYLGGSGVGQQHKVVEISGGKIRWNDRLQIPVAPMLGFVGVALVFVLLGIIAWRIMRAALAAENNFARIFCAGFLALIFIQVAINAGMNLGLMPITGITFPFLSYGGSSLISLFIGAGVIQSIFVNPSLGS